jgi:hypothetical protein
MYNSCLSPKKAGVAQDVIRNLEVQLFHRTNNGGFFLLREE